MLMKLVILIIFVVLAIISYQLLKAVLGKEAEGQKETTLNERWKGAAIAILFWGMFTYLVSSLCF